MKILDRIIESLFSTEPNEHEREFQEFHNRREWERDVFDSAMRNWLLRSGLGPVMVEQTREEWGEAHGLDEWPPEQFSMYARDTFDARRDDHAEIRDYVNGESDIDHYDPVAEALDEINLTQSAEKSVEDLKGGPGR